MQNGGAKGKKTRDLATSGILPFPVGRELGLFTAAFFCCVLEVKVSGRDFFCLGWLRVETELESLANALKSIHFFETARIVQD